METQMSHWWSAAPNWGWNKRDRIREGETVSCGAAERQKGGSLRVGGERPADKQCSKNREQVF